MSNLGLEGAFAAAEENLRERHKQSKTDLSQFTFSRITRKAKPAFSGKALRNACEEDGPLADLVRWLLSDDRPMGPSERYELAALLAGKLHARSGRRPTSPLMKLFYGDLIESARERKTALHQGGMKLGAAAEKAAEEAAMDWRASGTSADVIRDDMKRRKKRI